MLTRDPPYYKFWEKIIVSGNVMYVIYRRAMF